MKNLAHILIFIPFTCFGQDTLDLQLAATVPGYEILLASNGFLTTHITEPDSFDDNTGATITSHWYQTYDVANPRHPRLLDRSSIFHDILYPERFAPHSKEFLHSTMVRDNLLIGLKFNERRYTIEARELGSDHISWEIPLEGLHLGSENSLAWPGRMSLKDNYLLFAGGSLGLSVYDISARPARVFRLGQFSGNFYRFEDRLFLFTYTGLEIENNRQILEIDITDPENLEVVSVLNIRDIDGYNQILQIIGYFQGYLYIANQKKAREPGPYVAVFDYRDRENIRFAGLFELPGDPGGRYSTRYISAEINNGQLYSQNGKTLDIFSLENPVEPERIVSKRILGSRFKTLGNLLFTRYSGNQIGIYNIDSDSLVVPQHLSPKPHLLSLSAFPNPFNSSTTISYTIPVGTTNFNLSIYDLSGRQVTDLSPPRTGEFIRRPLANKVVWNASDQPAGLYFVRLEAGTQIKTQKFMLLK